MLFLGRANEGFDIAFRLEERSVTGTGLLSDDLSRRECGSLSVCEAEGL